ncbi:GPI ethanolamine phosphate transferase 3, partial [Asbolus verrucosus]
GFLLSKTAQKSNSTCLSFQEIPCLVQDTTVNGPGEQCSDNYKLSYLLQNINSASNVCLPQKARIVLVLIDALRYDFMLFNDKLQNPLPFQNKLPVIHRLMKQYPEFTRLYKFVADPPTTTMQRLKALTTGSLPTFIDAGSNFATNEINEDNIIDQLLRHNLSTVLIGDDTWDGLYPNRFLRKYPYPSFDVWDLDTVDNGVMTHLYPELNQTDWSFLIAHYLGVDHCGHRYGPNHSEMERKLTEMDTVIESVADKLDSNTMLFVIGDHGMTETGNHGGDSEDEVMSALFIYSKKPLSSLGEHTDTVRQVSLAPTMAAIFGVSVPFSNLGTVILDALPSFNNSHVQEWQWSLFYLWGNVQQMLTYIEEYAESSSETFSHAALKELKEKFSLLNSKLYAVTNEASFENFAKECTDFLTKLRETCEEVWIQFDSFSMTRGLLFLFLSLFFVYMITDGIPSNRLPEIFMSSFVIEESSVLLYLLNTVILIGTLSVSQGESKKKSHKSKLKLLAIALGILILVRGSMYFWRCRDRLEQPWCYETFNAFTAKVETTKLQWIITVITLGLFVTVTKVWLRNCGNLNGYSYTVILLKYVPTVLVVCMSGFWVLNRLPINTKNKSVQLWQANALAWVVYGLSAVGILTVIMKPLCIYILPSTDEYSTESENNKIPQLFQKVKKMFNEPRNEDVPVICGLGTVYSAVYIAIGIYLTHLFALLHGDAVAPSTVIMFLASAFVLIITSIIRLEKANTIGKLPNCKNPKNQLFEIPNMSLLVWVILSQYFFYGTGHQPSFPNIIWDAAFVGTSGIFKHNFVPATLIIINTFCSQILMGFLVPLLIIMPFTVSVMLPSVINKNIMQKENLRGEVLLYERDGLLITVAFTTICKYMICHGIRVFATMLAATIHCRHMMVWKIFAPKLIFESVGMFVTLSVACLSYLNRNGNNGSELSEKKENCETITNTENKVLNKCQSNFIKPT